MKRYFYIAIPFNNWQDNIFRWFGVPINPERAFNFDGFATDLEERQSKFISSLKEEWKNVPDYLLDPTTRSNFSVYMRAEEMETLSELDAHDGEFLVDNEGDYWVIEGSNIAYYNVSYARRGERIPINSERVDKMVFMKIPGWNGGGFTYIRHCMSRL